MHLVHFASKGQVSRDNIYLSKMLELMIFSATLVDCVFLPCSINILF